MIPVRPDTATSMLRMNFPVGAITDTLAIIPLVFPGSARHCLAATRATEPKGSYTFQYQFPIQRRHPEWIRIPT